LSRTIREFSGLRALVVEIGAQNDAHNTCVIVGNAPIFTHDAGGGRVMETNRQKIIARLERDGWQNRGGRSHDVFTNPQRLGVAIVVPRHRELSPGVARQIARTAGWQ
jgi:predicted RNA binding protein YcfA (HicA-like mRNA interferase family)